MVASSSLSKPAQPLSVPVALQQNVLLINTMPFPGLRQAFVDMGRGEVGGSGSAVPGDRKAHLGLNAGALVPFTSWRTVSSMATAQRVQEIGKRRAQRPVPSLLQEESRQALPHLASGGSLFCLPLLPSPGIVPHHFRAYKKHHPGLGDRAQNPPLGTSPKTPWWLWARAGAISPQTRTLVPGAPGMAISPAMKRA